MGRPAGPTRDTKALICERALDVFAEKGYTASTMRDIAHGAGMKDASLYNHFSSKRDLFDATVSLQLERLTNLLRSHQALAHPEDNAAAYATDDPNRLLSTVLASYEPFFSDPAIIKLRHILEAERHADPSIFQLYRTIFITRPIQLQETIFAQLIAPAGKPTLMGFACGHVLPTLALPLGRMCTLDASAGALRLDGC